MKLQILGSIVLATATSQGTNVTLVKPACNAIFTLVYPKIIFCYWCNVASSIDCTTHNVYIQLI
ncbi:hypothetical protein [Sulfolobus islandicus]|nr:hypothetical protein [Sulfolobus islandicus]